MYTVDELFRASKAIELVGRKLKVRALGDYELQLRNRFALLARVKAENSLKDPQSDDFKAVILPLREESDSVLRSTLTRMWDWESWQTAYQEIQPKYYPFPDKPTPEEEAEIVAKREAEPERLRNLREQFVKEKIEENQKRYAEADHAKLLSESERLIIRAYGQTESDAENVHRTLLMAVQKEDGSPYFKNLDEVRQLHSSVITKLMEEFSEVNNLDPLKLNGGVVTDSTKA